MYLTDIKNTPIKVTENILVMYDVSYIVCLYS